MTFRHLFMVVLGLAVSVAGCSRPPEPVDPVLIRLSGATSMQPVMRELTQAYGKRFSNVAFEFSAVGSAAGLESVARGAADIALVSRELAPNEEVDPRTNERRLVSTLVARDGIAVVVHKDNPVQDLKLSQIREIFEGQFTNWSEVGGADQEITVVSREEGSGTRLSFEDMAMNNHGVTLAALVMPSSEAVREYVAAHPGAIAYLSSGCLGEGVRALEVDGVALTPLAVERGTYPLTRAFLLVTRPDAREQANELVRFARSPAAQAIVRQAYGSARNVSRN